MQVEAAVAHAAGAALGIETVELEGPHAGGEIATRSFQLVTGRRWIGTAFGGMRGRAGVPKIVDRHLQGRIEVDPMITHRLKLADIDRGFERMHGGESIRSVVAY